MTTGLPRIATGMNSSPDPRVLQTLGMEGVALTVWERALPEPLVAALDALDATALPQLQRQVNVATVAAIVREACAEAGAGACAVPLVDEIERLVAHAAQVFAAPVLNLRLDATDGPPGPKWQVDAVRGRLLCTLLGPGTEFGPIAPDGTPQSVHRLARGAVGVFRGVFWPGPELAAVVHRAPPRAAGGPRLVVAIDPVDDAGTC